MANPIIYRNFGDMKFRTEIEIKRGKTTLDPHKTVTTVGSCFAENIADCMNRVLWPVINPCGTLFNPTSIRQVLQLLLLTDEKRALEIFEQSIFNIGDVWLSWLFDSTIGCETREELFFSFKEMRHEMRDAVKEGNTLIVTFGTAYVYAHLELHDIFQHANEDTRLIVSNCHKQPGAKFTRFRLTVEEIVNQWDIFLKNLFRTYPELHIIFTVSPVRHIRDGATDNTRSKATLHLAIDELTRRFERTEYFPAYELVMDDLRDYRFYSADMTHPSPEALNYIWEHFKSSYLDSDGLKRIMDGENLYRRLNHRPIHKWTKQYLNFEMETSRLLKDFTEGY